MCNFNTDTDRKNTTLIKKSVILCFLCLYNLITTKSQVTCLVFKINKMTRSFIIYCYSLFIEISIQYFAGYPNSIIRYKRLISTKRLLLVNSENFTQIGSQVWPAHLVTSTLDESNATRVRHKQHECNTSATRVLH